MGSVSETVVPGEGAVENSQGSKNDGVIEVSGGLTFDDVSESMFSEAEKKAEKEIKKSEKKSKVPEAKDEDEGTGFDDDSEKKVSKEQKAVEKQIKKLKAKYEDQDIEIPEDATIPVKIDGKEQFINLREVINGYSGTSAVSKRFTELDKSRKQHQTELEFAKSLQQRIAPLKELAGTSPLDFLNQAVDLIGLDPYTVFKGVRESMIPEIQEYLGMDEYQRKAYDLEQDNKFLLRRHESLNQKFESEKQVANLRTQISELKEVHSLSDDEFQSAYDRLKKHNVNGITPEIIANEARGYKRYVKAIDIVESVNPDLIHNRQMVELIAGNIDDFSEEELSEMVQESIKNKVRQAASPSSKQIQTERRERDYLTFDDLGDDE